MAYTEGKPWEEIDQESGALNMSSYTATALFSMAELAVEELSKAGIRLTGPLVRQLTRTFMKVCNAVQRQLRPDDSVDWNAGSHTRVRGAFRTVLKTMPPPIIVDGKPGSLEDFDKWCEDAERRCLAIARVAIAVWAEEMPENPNEDLADLLSETVEVD